MWRWSKPWPTRSRRCKFYEDPHVIVDVGGQDIKLIVLKNGRVKDFKLNTQCSAGNGYFLQSTAEGFGLRSSNTPIWRSPPIPCRYSDTAARSSCSPTSSTSSGRVGAQKKSWPGWRRCCRRTFSCMWPAFRIWRLWARASFCKAGHKTTSRWSKLRWTSSANSFRAAGKKPEIIVHEYCGESGAIGAASRAVRLWRNGTADHLHRPGCRPQDRVPHHAQRSYALPFLQERLPAHVHRHQHRAQGDLSLVPITQKITKVPLMHGRAAPDHRHLRKGPGRRCQRHEGHQGRNRPDKDKHPNFVDIAAHEVFRPVNPKSVADPDPGHEILEQGGTKSASR